MTAAAGFKWSAEPDLRKRSYLSKKEMPTSEVNRRTMGVFLPDSRTLWNTQVAAGYTPAEAKRVAGTLLPDVLPYDPRRPASFPDNGRKLTDDAFDLFIRILTNGKVTEDKVGPHGDLLLDFPYVGPPHRGVSNGRA